MKIFSSFAWAAINAGGTVGPYDPVTGKVLFNVVMAAGIGYLFGWAASELWAWARHRRVAKHHR